MTAQDFPALSIEEIRSVLNQGTINTLDDIQVHSSIPSTNDELWHRLNQGKTTPAACLSESQTAGRGRRGDRWHSPSSGNLYLSLFWPFPAETMTNGLTIAIG
ncbi:MAG TPA: biotin--[acetyl-CoA-carboxylase] ligase, partial [Methylophaga sp.]|nr:biotin--[acetyl-CoA-carboxylase] ligase [Methylophaga sp.]